MDRYKFQSIAETLGEMRAAIDNQVGDTSRNPAAKLALEAVLARIYGSTLFHDEDTAIQFMQFGVRQDIGLGLQGTEIESNETDDVCYNVLGINDTNGYIIANNRTHFTRYDGQYSSPTIPSKYLLSSTINTEFDPDSWTNMLYPPILGLTNNQFTDSIAILPNDKSVYPLSFCIKTGDTVVSALLVGPKITPEFFPNEWENCSYFPYIPSDYIEVARFIIGNSIDDAELTVLWMKQLISTFAAPPIKDENIFLYILSALKAFIVRFRKFDIGDFLSNLTFDTLVPFIGTPTYLASKLTDVSDPTSNGSSVFRGLIKTPSNPEMFVNGRSKAIYLTNNAREVVADLAGLPSSVELLKFDANNLYFTAERLKTSNQFEIYQYYTNQCFNVDMGNGGTKLSKDYTFRLNLEDQEQNILIKDWYIMASKYFVTEEEYIQRLNSGQGVLGYFTQNTIDLIDEWRLYGYAGIVPDLSMEKSKPLYTRVVSPYDNKYITEEEYTKKLRDQGYSQAQIDERVSIYLDNGGIFYTVDNSQYPDDFVAIQEAALTITEYTYASEPYWIAAFPDFFSSTQNEFGQLKADSFTIAPSGLATGNLEIQIAGGDEVLNRIATGTNLVFDETTRAFRIKLSEMGVYNPVSISDVKFQMRIMIDDDVTSPTDFVAGIEDYIQISLYTDKNARPNDKLATGNIVHIRDLQQNNYSEVKFDLSYLLGSSNVDRACPTYWLVLEKTGCPEVVEINILAGNVSGRINNISYKNVLDAWVPDNDNYDKEAWIEFTTPVPAILAAFNRNDFVVSSVLPPPNNKRQLNESYVVEGYWGFTIQDMAEPRILSIYPRAVLYNESNSTVPAKLFDSVKAATTNSTEVKIDSNSYVSASGVNGIMSASGMVSASGINIIDDTLVYIGDRILLKNYTGQFEKFNGVWEITDANAVQMWLMRTYDADSADEIPLTASVRVLQGTMNKGVNYAVDKSPDILNTDPISFISYQSSYRYIPNNRDIHVLVRMRKRDQLIDIYKLIPAGNVEPIILSTELVDGVSFLAIAKGDDKYAVKYSTTQESDVQFYSFSNNIISASGYVNTIDGKTLIDGDRILIQHLSGDLAKYNGIYTYNEPNLSDVAPFELFIRADDMNESAEVFNGLAVRVLDGQVGSNFKSNYYKLDVSDYPIVLNNTSLFFVKTDPIMPDEFKAPKYGGSLSDKLAIRSI